MSQAFFPGSTVGGKTRGLFYMSRFWLSGTLEERTYFFDGQGNVYVDPVSAQASDLSKASEKGTYSLSGDQLEITLGTARPVKASYSSDSSNTFSWNMGIFSSAQPVDWSKFAGEFEGGNASRSGGSFAGSSRTYRFYSTGTLIAQSLGSVSTSSVSASSQSNQSGSWSADGYELTLDIGGTVTKNVAYLINSLPDRLIIQGARFKFEPTSVSSTPPAISTTFINT